MELARQKIRYNERMETTNIQLGEYEHFKSKDMRYEVLGVARHSETLEEFVIYKKLYGDHSTWIRPLGAHLNNRFRYNMAGFSSERHEARRGIAVATTRRDEWRAAENTDMLVEIGLLR